MASIELDIAADDMDPADAARLMAQRHRLAMEVVKEDGPGAGWPVCRFSGHRKDIAAMLLEYTDGDPKEAVSLGVDIRE